MASSVGSVVAVAVGSIVAVPAGSVMGVGVGSVVAVAVGSGVSVLVAVLVGSSVAVGVLVVIGAGVSNVVSTVLGVLGTVPPVLGHAAATARPKAWITVLLAGPEVRAVTVNLMLTTGESITRYVTELVTPGTT